MHLLCLCVLMVVVARVESQELTVRNIIQNRVDLTWVNSYMHATDVLALLGNPAIKNNTFFATYNLYFASLPTASIYKLNGTTPIDLNVYFQYHLVPGEIWSPAMMGEGQMMKLRTGYTTSYIFVNKILDTLFVNDAQVIHSDLLALNGRCHVIDKFFVDSRYGLQVASGLTAYAFLEADKSDMYSIFKAYNDYTVTGSIPPDPKFGSVVIDYIGNAAAYCTLFVPDNNSIFKLKTKYEDLYSKIKGLSPGLMKQVLESSVIPNFAYHVNVLLYLSANGVQVPAIKGHIKMYTLNNEVFVLNECGKAKITRSDIKSNNCIIHYVDNFFGFAANTTYWTIMTDPNLFDIKTHLYRTPAAIISLLNPVGGVESKAKYADKYTIFIPIDSAFYLNDLSKDQAVLTEQLEMLMVKGVVDLTYFEGSMTLQTLRPGYDVTIWKKGQEMWVAVNNVRGRIVESNICTINGMIHKVDRTIGVPFATLGVFLGLDKADQRLFSILEQTGLLTSLLNPTNNLTFFAVNQSAVEKISPMFMGQQNKNKLKDLMYRHVGSSPLYLHSVAVGSSVSYVTFNGDVTIVNDNGIYWVHTDEGKVKVLDYDMKMENGVLHIVSDFFSYQPSSALHLSTLSYSSILALASISCTFLTSGTYNQWTLSS